MFRCEVYRKTRSATAKKKLVATDKRKEVAKGNKVTKKTADANKPKLSGFERGLIPEKIMSVTDCFGPLHFAMKWVGKKEIEYVPAKEAHKKCQQLVIKYYQENFAWKKKEVNQPKKSTNIRTRRTNKRDPI